MKTTKPLSRKSPPRRSQPKRDWSAAREKVEQEGECRLTGLVFPAEGRAHIDCEGPLEAAHTIGRELDLQATGVTIGRPGSPKGLTHEVKPKRIVPLCRYHHRLYDAHEIDLLPVLTLDEQVQAVLDAGSLELARKRTAPSAYR